MDATPPPVAFPGALQAAGLLAAAFVLMMVFGCGTGVLQMALSGVLGTAATPGTVHPALTAVANLAALGLVVAAGVWLARASVGEVLGLRGVSGWLLLPMAATVLGASALMSEADNLLRSVLPMPQVVARMFEETFSGQQSVWGSVLLVVVVAPLTEETLFRGVILRGFLMRYRPGLAIASTAVLFALFHANPWQLAAPLVLGALFGWWMLHTRSLWPCLLGHALNNGIPVTCQALGVEVRGYTTAFSEEIVYQPWWFDLGGAVLMMLGFVATWLLLRRGSRAAEWTAEASGHGDAVPGVAGAEHGEGGALEGGGLPAAGGGDPGVAGGAAVEDQ